MMKYRITEYGRLFYPEYKNTFFWRAIPVRLHTWHNEYVYCAGSFDEAYHAIEIFKERGDISKFKVIEVD